MPRKGRRNRCPPPSNKAIPGMEQKDFNADDLEHLSRSWIKVANESAQYDVKLTKELIGDRTRATCTSFWKLVRKEYSSLTPRAHAKTFHELYNQWNIILPHLTEFLTTFTHLWKGCKLSGQDAEARCEQAFTAVQEAFRATHGHDFEHETTARLLIHHAQWSTILKPLLIPDNDGAENESSTSKEDQMFPTKAPIPENVSLAPDDGEADSEASTPRDEEYDDQSLTPNPELVASTYPSVVRVTRLRADLESDVEDDTSRHVKQRLDTTTQAALPLFPTTDFQLGEDAAAKKLEVLERQLEWDIMTRNEDDLSPEGVEYLRIQRTQILNRMRKQIQEQ